MVRLHSELEGPWGEEGHSEAPSPFRLWSLFASWYGAGRWLGGLCPTLTGAGAALWGVAWRGRQSLLGQVTWTPPLSAPQENKVPATF